MKQFIHLNNLFYIKHRKNKNGSAARNTGLSQSKGKYVSFLDDDDELMPDKIRSQVSLLESNQFYNGCYCKFISYFKDKEVLRSSYNKNGNSAFEIFSLKAQIHTSSLLLNRKTILEMNGFDETFIRHQDYEFLIRYFSNNELFCIEDFLLKVNTESEVNRPNVDKLITAKKHFFFKMKKYYNQYEKKKKLAIKKAHDLEVVRVCVKRKDPRMFKYLLLSRLNLIDIRVYMLPVLKKYLKRYL